MRSSSELAVSNLWISYCECISALAGPLAAAGLLVIGGPQAVLAGCAAAGVVAAVVSVVGADPGPPPGSDLRTWRLGPVLHGAVDTVRARPWTAGILGVAAARYLILGALDVLLVVLAFDALDLGSGGAGVLNALVGVGALVSAVVATVVARRARLAPWLAVALSVSAVLFVALGVSTTLPVAVIALPVIGLGATLIDSLGRMLLQRSADPRVLASMFALVEFVGGVGLLVGSGIAQVLIAIGDVELALVGVGAFVGVMLLLTGRSVWRADAGADLPVVEMSLLRELPMFSPLPAISLESVARSAVPVPVAAGEVVITQGESGEHFYAVADGAFDVVMSGQRCVSPSAAASSARSPSWRTCPARPPSPRSPTARCSRSTGCRSSSRSPAATCPTRRRGASSGPSTSIFTSRPNPGTTRRSPRPPDARLSPPRRSAVRGAIIGGCWTRCYDSLTACRSGR